MEFATIPGAQLPELLRAMPKAEPHLGGQTPARSLSCHQFLPFLVIKIRTRSDAKADQKRANSEPKAVHIGWLLHLVLFTR